MLDFTKGHFKYLLAASASALLLGIAAYATLQPESASPEDSLCYDQIKQAIDAARSSGEVIVPAFSYDDVSKITCSATPGFLQFEIKGTDANGNSFHVYLKSGGRAASGADTIYDYCYMQDAANVSGKRISGREGAVSEPSCAYDPGFIANPTDTYEFSR